MRRSQILTALIALAMTLLFSIAASAQTGQLRGHVVIRQEDGTTAPLAGAVIDVFRTDIGGKYETKADKRGQFVFAGVPFTGDYIISASAPNAAPYAKGNVKAGRDIDFELSLVTGDGHRYTETEAKAAVKTVGTDSSKAGDAAAEKARRDAAAAKQLETEKTKVANLNETLNRALKSGDQAMTAKNYDEAIRQYDEGMTADPEQVVFYSRKANALRSRGVDHYNTSVKATDQAVKTSELEAAKKDFQLSAESVNKGWEVAKKETASTDPSGQQGQTARKLEVLAGRAETMRLLVKTDSTQMEAALVAYQEYMAAETDAVKKAKAERDVAQILFDSSSDAAGFERAVAAYKKLLEANPEDAEAMLRIGQALFNIGAMNNNDKAKYQEAANYLQMYVSKAPEGQLKSEAKDLIEALKAQANVTPERINPPPRRKRP
jgi:tetratricopeptide (TPR) repeat protein